MFCPGVKPIHRRLFQRAAMPIPAKKCEKTRADWLPKAKIGGVIAGDDYHEKWPLVKDTINRFIDATGFDLIVSQTVEDDVKISNYLS